jgi:hypothetical protein
MEKTIPLILKGAESMACQKYSEPVAQDVYLLERMSGKKFYADDIWD